MVTTPKKQQPIELSKSAAKQIADLLQAENNSSLRFRIYIIGGGCSGFQYGFSFDEEFAEDDWQLQIVTPNDATDITTPIVIDSMSLPYLKGATIDYVRDLQGRRFKVDNPNANTTCSCGSSFSIANSDAE